MATVTYPGVYVDEASSGVRPLDIASTSTAAFVGLAEKGPTVATRITSWTEFRRLYGDFITDGKLAHPMPELDPSIELVNDNTPQISRMQIDLLVNSLANDMTRIATLQYMRSVGQAQMRWLGIQEGHHSLSHEPDNNQDAYGKLKKINTWFAGELAYLAKRLAETPEPSGDGSMLDHTLIVWTNELGKGNSHTLDNIPCVIIGGAPGVKTGRSLKLEKTPHNRLWLALAHTMGHDQLQAFGKAELCEGGALSLA